MERRLFSLTGKLICKDSTGKQSICCSQADLKLCRQGERGGNLSMKNLSYCFRAVSHEVWRSGVIYGHRHSGMSLYFKHQWNHDGTVCLYLCLCERGVFSGKLHSF